MGRAGPNVEQVARDLEALLAGHSPAAAAAARSTPAAPGSAAPSLDIT
jgi:hypothetical protein